MGKKRRNLLPIIATVQVVLIIAVLGVTFGFIIPAIDSEANADVIVSLSGVVSEVSDDRGIVHSLTINFAFEVDKISEFDASALRDGISELISGMRYEQISEFNGMEFIRSNVEEYVNEITSGKYTVEVFITDMTSNVLPQASKASNS